MLMTTTNIDLNRKLSPQKLWAVVSAASIAAYIIAEGKM